MAAEVIVNFSRYPRSKRRRHTALGARIQHGLTEQKKTRDALARAQRLERSAHCSGVAHDLNNVLTANLMCADLLAQRL